MRSLHDLRTTSDPVLNPLLERLALLESANYRLRSTLSERSFNVEVSNAALHEQLARAKEDISRHQDQIENFCHEILAAVQARDRALAVADETLKAHAELLAQRDSLRLALDAARAASAGDNARDASARLELEDALRVAQAAADGNLRLHLEAVAQRDGLQQKLLEALEASAAAQARDEQSRRTLEEFIREAQAATDEHIKMHLEMAAQRDELKQRHREALEASADAQARDEQRHLEALKASADAQARDEQSRHTLDEYIRAAQTAADENLKVRADMESQRDGLQRRIDGLSLQLEESRKASAEFVRTTQAAADEKLLVRLKLTAQRDALQQQVRELQQQLAEAQKAKEQREAEHPSMKDVLDPAWAKLLHLLKPPLQAAYAQLRRLSAGSMPAGQRTILRLTGSSLSQAVDSLATIELALADSPATTDAAPVLPVLESVLATWDAVFRRRGITLTREFPHSLPNSPHDPEQLRLALHHILRNATEALTRGTTLRVHLSKVADAAVLEFRDDGPGYPAAWLQKQFEPFVSPRPGHAGLGLAAVRRALRRWGGDVTAANAAKGSGTRLTLTFAPAPLPPAAKP